jgi:hypothetical protein
MRNTKRSSRRHHSRAAAPRGQRRASHDAGTTDHRPLDARDTDIGPIRGVDAGVAFGHLEPTVLLQRNGAVGPQPNDTALAHIGSPPEANREDGNE